MRMFGGIRRLTDRIDDTVGGAEEVLARSDTAITVATVAFSLVAVAALAALIVSATSAATSRVRCSCAG